MNGEVVAVQADYASNFLNLSIEKYQASNIKDTIGKWKLELILHKQNENLDQAAVTVKKIAKAYYFIGDNEQAIKYWQQTSLLYDQIKDFSGLGKSLIGQSQAYQSLGKASKAMTFAQKALHIARTNSDNNLIIAALGSRGEAYYLQGKYRLAIADFRSGLNLVSTINNSYYKICLLNSLGKVYISLARIYDRRIKSTLELGDNQEIEKWRKIAYRYDDAALKALQQSSQLAKKSEDKQLQINSIISSIPPASRIYQSNVVETKFKEAVLITSSLPDSHFKAYTLIKLAQLAKTLPIGTDLSITSCSQSIEYEQSITSSQLLNQAIKIAKTLKSDDALALAFGNLGHIYECRKEYQQALNFTKKAQLIAKRASNSKNSLYLWKWQEGRIFKELNQLPKAIIPYEQAINNLENIRSNIIVYNQDLQLELHNSVEPIYRQFIEIKLNLLDKYYSNSHDSRKNNSNVLSQVLPIIEKLKLIEIQNYFGEESIYKSVRTKNSNFLKSNQNTVIFCSVILNKRTAIIASFPNGINKLTWINKDSKSIKKEIDKFRIELEKRSNLIYNPHQAQKLYDWIIAPFVKDLDSLQIKTLVFINDGILRSVPMAALHNGNQFLIEKYSIANTLSLALTDKSILKHNKFQVLSAALTKNAVINGQVYPALDYVAKEINQISGMFPDSKQLLNENFTYKRLQSELQQTLYPIIHIATHAEFSSVLEDTFLVTGNNQKLTIPELDKLIRNVVSEHNSIDLLTLTACETAAGDEVAALGLAGVAFQAGVKSTLASLWSINDAATVSLITEFYQEWYNSKVSKAEALQRAQQKLISLGGQQAHPYYWAPFILIGNWQ